MLAASIEVPRDVKRSITCPPCPDCFRRKNTIPVTLYGWVVPNKWFCTRCKFMWLTSEVQ
jgi:hypothetical protein